VKMTDCAFRRQQVRPRNSRREDALAVEHRARPSSIRRKAVASPTKVAVEEYKNDAVKITWEGGNGNAVGFRVERRIADGNGDLSPTARRKHKGTRECANVDRLHRPDGQELRYRTVSINAMDNDAGASKPTDSITLNRPYIAICFDFISPFLALLLAVTSSQSRHRESAVKAITIGIRLQQIQEARRTVRARFCFLLCDGVCR